MANGAPRVNRYLEDQSQNVQRDTSVVAAAVLKAVKGDPDTAMSVIDTNDFLTKFTPNGRIEPTFDKGYWVCYKYIKETGPMLIQRACKNATYGGSYPALIGTEQNYEITGAISNVDEFAFSDATVPFILTGIDPGEYNDEITYDIIPYQTDEDLTSADLVDSLFTVNNAWFTGDSVYLMPLTGELPAEFDQDTVYYVALQEDGKVGLATSPQNAAANTYITVTTVPLDSTWKLIPNFRVEALEGTQVLQVRYRGVLVDAERYIVSLNPNAVDADNAPLWIGTQLEYSSYIKIKTNDQFNFYGRVTPLMKKVTGAPLGGGSNGVTVTDSELISSLNSFRNADTSSFKIFFDTGYTGAGYQGAIASLLSSREDAVGLGSIPMSLEKSNRAVDAIINYVSYQVNINTPYFSFFTPSVVIQDEFNNGREIEISPVPFVASLYAAVMTSTTPFKAPAGTRRGILSPEVLRLVKYFAWEKQDGGEFGRLYDANVNALRLIKNRGLTLWGQKNTQKVPSKTDRNNVMLLLITIGPDLENFLNDYIFEDNVPVTWDEINQLITAYMEEIKAQGGLDTRSDEGYELIIDETVNTDTVIDNNELVVLLRIKPRSVGEYLSLRIAILSSGATVSAA